MLSPSRSLILPPSLLSEDRGSSISTYSNFCPTPTCGACGRVGGRRLRSTRWPAAGPLSRMLPRKFSLWKLRDKERGKNAAPDGHFRGWPLVRVWGVSRVDQREGERGRERERERENTKLMFLIFLGGDGLRRFKSMTTSSHLLRVFFNFARVRPRVRARARARASL